MQQQGMRSQRRRSQALFEVLLSRLLLRGVSKGRLEESQEALPASGAQSPEAQPILRRVHRQHTGSHREVRVSGVGVPQAQPSHRGSDMSQRRGRANATRRDDSEKRMGDGEGHAEHLLRRLRRRGRGEDEGWRVLR